MTRVRHWRATACRGLAGLLVAMAAAAPATAQQTLSASELAETCARDAPTWADFCNGYFQAVHDYGALLGEVCAPTGVSRSDLVALYTRYAPPFIAETPGAGEANGLVVAVSIVAAEYPCSE